MFKQLSEKIKGIYHSFTYKTVLASLILSFLLFIIGGLGLYKIYTDSRYYRNQYIHLYNIPLELFYLYETESLTTITSVLSQDTSYQERIEEIRKRRESQLNLFRKFYSDAYKKFLHLTPPQLTLILATLDQLHHEALSLSEQKHFQKAKILLTSPRYHQLTQEFQDNYQTLLRTIDFEMNQFRKKQTKRTKLFLATIFVIFVLVIAIWAWELKILKRHIEARRLNEERIKRYMKELEKLNEELDQFAYIASHDLKAPLRAISNLASWIREDLGKNLPPDTSHHVDLMIGRVKRMENLIDGILQYSRIGRVYTDLETIEVKKLIDDAIFLLNPPPHISIHLPEKMPTITTRPLMFSQVISNLISNAIKYHDKNSGNIWISYHQADGFYHFSVKDDGPGIHPQFHEKIFVIFQTLQPRDRVESTGVGLALVKKILQEEGGEIHIHSNENEGADFRFSWPISPITPTKKQPSNIFPKTHFLESQPKG